VVQVELDGRWSVVGHLNGGYLAALVAQHASRALDDAPALTISAHYLEAADGGEVVDLAVQVVRRGRLSTARVRLLREDAVVLDSLVTCGRVRDNPDVLEAAHRPRLPAHQECVDGAEVMVGPANSLMTHLSVRVDPADAAAMIAALAGRPPAAAAGGAQCSATVAYRDGTASDRFLAAVAWDALPPCPWRVGLVAYLPTVAAQVMLLADPAPGPLVVQTRADTVRHGQVDETARVWDETGTLVASARQSALYVPFPPS
jgi:hypothetical protein